DAVQLLAEVPGLGADSAQQIIAEVGATAATFPSSKHLASSMGKSTHDASIYPPEFVTSTAGSTSRCLGKVAATALWRDQAFVASTSEKGECVGVTFATVRPAALKRALNSRSVRSRPGSSTNMLRSIIC